MKYAEMVRNIFDRGLHYVDGCCDCPFILGEDNQCWLTGTELAEDIEPGKDRPPADCPLKTQNVTIMLRKRKP